MRKTILRRMKKLSNTIAAHARRYYAVLDEQWDQTDWSRKQADVVLGRMQKVIEQLPKAIWQAHERIIGERRVENAQKILSLYEPEVRVMVRGKSGTEVEFGNALYLVENRDGLIVDWKYMSDQPRSDSALVKESIGRVSANYGRPESYTADRGFFSAANSKYLGEQGSYDAICPKPVAALGERLREPRFCELQKRRGGTEARIGIFKNVYSGRPLRSKGIDHRESPGRASGSSTKAAVEHLLTGFSEAPCAVCSILEVMAPRLRPLSIPLRPCDVPQHLDGRPSGRGNSRRDAYGPTSLIARSPALVAARNA